MILTQRERDLRAVAKFLSLDIRRAHKAIVTHQPHARGWCLGCGCVRYTAWPCWLYTLATDAVTAHDKAAACADFVNALIPRQRVAPVLQSVPTRVGPMYWHRNAAPPYVRIRKSPRRQENGRFVAEREAPHDASCAVSRAGAEPRRPVETHATHRP